VPESSFVDDLKADLFDADTVYVVLDNHKEGDYRPMVYKSTDRGANWSSIVGDLPERHLVWRLVQDHVNPSLLFAGTEFGVFFTVDGGGKWIQLTGGAPTISFRDLAIQRRENDLVGATFGRGFWILDDYTPLRDVSEELLEREAHLFPVRDAWWYIQRRTLGDDEEAKASQGHGYFTAPNPPFGAVFTFYLKDELDTREDRRQEKEGEIQEAGGDNPYPGWEALEAEAREEDPAIVLTVRDAGGDVVRRFEGSTSAGIQRVSWDLRYPSSGPITSADPPEDPIDDAGFLVAPGTYTITVARRVEGRLTQIAGPESFEVKRMRTGTLEGATPAERTAFMKELAEAYRVLQGVEKIVESAAERLASIKRALLLSTVDGTELDDEARRLEQRVFGFRRVIDGNEQKDDMGEPTVPSIGNRLGVAFIGNYWSTYGPTPTHERSLEIGLEQLGEVAAKVERLVEVDLPALEDRLEKAGVPWTTGRKVPGG